MEFLVRQPNHKANNRGKKKTDVIEKYKFIPKIPLSPQFLSNLPTRLKPEATADQSNAQSDLPDIEKISACSTPATNNTGDAFCHVVSIVQPKFKNGKNILMHAVSGI